jgi:hypothetical protein
MAGDGDSSDGRDALGQFDRTGAFDAAGGQQ